tara:strand:+ start:9881 stop:10606 length:726 start_codon:yes stop_codon:yes gene_type:complete
VVVTQLGGLLRGYPKRPTSINLRERGLGGVYNQEGKLIDVLDRPLLHGTKFDFDRFDDSYWDIFAPDNILEKGFWHTSSPKTAEYYSRTTPYHPQDIPMPKHRRKEMQEILDREGNRRILLNKLLGDYQEFDMKNLIYGVDNVPKSMMKDSRRTKRTVKSKMLDVIKDARERGYQGVKFKSLSDADQLQPSPADHYMTFEGKNIKPWFSPKMLMPFGVGGLLSDELRNLDLGSFQSEDGFI